MLRLLSCLALFAATNLFSSCAPHEDDPNKVSTIPWNRPEKWEGQGPMGSMMPGSQ